MRFKDFLFSVSVIGITVICMMNSSGCANIIPPSGGPRDSLPPKLIKVVPGDSSINFPGRKITFSFDEYIDLQNVQSNLIVSPIPATSPTVDYRLNMMTVKFTDSLKANTTYTLNFGNAIKDYNEGNVLNGFTYIFSTGPAIDSLSLRGKVLLAETGKTDSTLIVILHKNSDDSAVVKNRPDYMTKLDGNGNFIFRNMPSGTYYLFALQDQGGSRRYMDTKQLFAFAGAPVSLPIQTAPITLSAYAEKQNSTSQPQAGIRPKAGAGDNRLKYQTSIFNGRQDILEKFTFTFETPLKKFDTTKIRFATDSVFTGIKNYSWEKDSAGLKFRLNYPWKENTLYHLLVEKNFAEDTSGRVLLKPDTLSFRTRNKNEYGSLVIHFRNLDLALNPVLQLLQGNEIKKSIPFITAEINEPLFSPGDYSLRILYDRNKNGKWDAGEFFGKHKQPEIVIPIERTISIKANFINEFEISAPSNSP